MQAAAHPLSMIKVCTNAALEENVRLLLESENRVAQILQYLLPFAEDGDEHLVLRPSLITWYSILNWQL